MNKISYHLLWFVLFFGVESPIFSQNFMNILNGRYYYLPTSSFTNSDEPLQFSEYRIETTLPYQFKQGSAIGLKPQYKTFLLDGTSDSLTDLQLHTFKLPFFVLIKFNESKWSMYLDISPKLNSDLKNIKGNHYQIGSTVLFFYEMQKDFFWQFGVYYNQDTYGPFIMPLFGLDWKINDRNYLAALLPAYLLYEHKIGKKIYTGFELELTGETFRLGETKYTNSYISQLGINKLTFLTEPRLFIDYYVAKHFVIYVKPGFRLFQKYEHFNTSDQLIAESDHVQGNMKNSFYIEFGAALRFRYDEVKDEPQAQN